MSLTTKFLVTGGAGFIGSNLADELILQGVTCHHHRKFVTGFRENLERSKVTSIYRGRINDDAALQRRSTALRSFSSGRSAKRSAFGRRPGGTHEACVNGTLNLLIKSKEARVNRFIYAASSSAYGDQPTLPKVERCAPIRSRRTPSQN